MNEPESVEDLVRILDYLAVLVSWMEHKQTLSNAHQVSKGKDISTGKAGTP